ncbi:kinase-like domain-containing protein [Thamnidium elegans]|nr:kinase-like domain-containing protein [Thamnidium elegans]
MPRWFNTPLQLHRRWKETKNQQNNKRCINGQYKLLHEIGHGASGIVHLAVDIKTNVRYAIKELNKPKLQRQYHSELLRQSGPARRRRNLSSSSESSLEDTLTLLGVAQSKRRKLNQNHDNETAINDLFIEESNLLKKLAPHENIIHFIKVIEDPNYLDSIFIVMEYAEKGIVMDVTPHSVTKSFSDTQCRNIFKQLVEAVNHLHTNGIVHRDIKPQNLLLSSDNLVKLIDFGNATTVSDTLSYNSTGTPAFMAPELLKKVPRNQVQIPPTCADLWSMGVTLYCFTYGRLPFEKASLLDLYADIQNKSLSHPSSSEKVDLDLIDLIDKLLEKNPTNRITIDKVMSHPWLSK